MSVVITVHLLYRAIGITCKSGTYTTNGCIPMGGFYSASEKADEANRKWRESLP